MKKQVYKNIITALVFVLISTTVNAAFEKREDRQKTGISKTNGLANPSLQGKPSRIDNPGGGNGTENPGGPETGTPIGDALPILLGLGVIYGVYIFGKKRKEA